MLSTKPFQCPCCNYNFTSKDSVRGYSSSHFPLIIKCSHTVCESCVKNAAKAQKKILCSVCQCQTDFAEGEYAVAKLLPDFYVLGVLSANVKQIPHSLKLKMVPAGISKESENLRNKDKAAIQCSECNKRLASWRCDKCEENFCNVCFDQIHDKSIKAMKKHEGKPIYVEEYHSMVQQGCSEHSQRPIEFFCDDDNELACSYCVVMGKHKGHSVLTLYEKNKSCSDDLKKAVEESQQVLRRMRFTENKLAQIIPTEKIDTTHYVKDIQNHFHRFHAMLQIRESELIMQVETIGNSSVSALENMRQQVSDYQKELIALLRDAEQSLKNPYLSVSATSIIKKLETTKQHSYHLVPIETENDWTKGIDLIFEDNLNERIKEYGQVNADIQTRYCLKSDESLPEGFVLETLPDDGSIVTDSESVTSHSDNLSEDSLTVPKVNSVSIPLSVVMKQKQCSSLRQEMVIVSHIRHPESFWIQRCSESRKLKTMSDAINKWCRNSESSKHIPTAVNKGDLYLVKYSADNRWYRARIKKLPGKNGSGTNPDGERENSDDEISKEEIVGDKRVEVIYVDYGNTEIVPLSRLRNIQTRFLNLPGMAMECSLWDISPLQGDTWSNETVKTFAKFVGNKQVFMQVVEQRNDVFYVDLSQPASNDILNDVPVSVRDALVFLELGCFISGSTLKSKKSKAARQFMPPEQLRANAKVNIILSHVESPSFFYVQQLSTARYLSDAIFEMQKVYNAEVGTLHNIYVPTVGMICAAQYSVDKQWYRAEVISLPGGCLVEVQYVDFGNKEIVHHGRLKKLFDRFIRLNKQAIPCCLTDVNYNQQTNWSKEASQWLTKIAEKKQLMLKSHGMIPGEQKAQVVLYDVQEDTEICINALMVEEGMASSCGPSSEVVRISRPIPAPKAFKLEFSVPIVSIGGEAKESAEQNQNNSDNKESETVLKTIKPPQDFKNDLVPVHVSYIETPSLFYIQIATKEENKLNGLMEELQEAYRQLEGEVSDLSEGTKYAVKNLKDNKWYRGSIVSKTDDSHVKVHFLDYGFMDNISVKNLRILLKRFCLDGAFAVTCHLANIQAAGDSKKWSQVACERFKELVSEFEVLYLTRKGGLKGGSLATDLLIKEICRGGALEPTTIKYTSVTEQLIEKGVALPTRDAKEKAATPENPKVHSTEVLSSDVPVQAKKSVVILPPKPKFQWKPPEYPKEQHFNAMPTNVGEDNCIFLHSLEKGACNIELIKKALQCKYSNATYDSLRIPPPVGQACVAKYSVDQNWYRAEVLSCYMDKVKVLFVDYGNDETVSLENIRTELIMTDFPQQCFECDLHGIRPISKEGKWPTKVLDFVHDTVVEQKCMVEVMEPHEAGNRLKILLTLPTGVEVTDLLKQMGEALSVNDPELSCGDAAPLTTVQIKKPSVISTISPFKTASKLKEGEPFSVCITQLLEPNIVFLQQMKVLEPKSEIDEARNEELDKFLKLVEELSERANNFPQVSYPEKGMACCARYTHDNNWYRCVITSLSEEGISVTYVDYGNSEVIPLDRLKILEDKFIDFPVQAHCCKLNAVEPAAGNWTTEALQAMVKELFHNDEPMFARVITQGETYEVDLLLKAEGNNSMKLVYQSIADQGIIKLNKCDQV